MDNCVVYIINPFSHAAALADICAAFWHLFQQLAADADRRETRQVNDVALQIIPMDLIFSGESVVVPTQTDYLNLALEVYSRCRPKDAESSPVLCAPAVLLADPLPKSINFRLAPDKSSPLQDGRNLHIACSKSSDQRWMSVAWSDGTGSIQTTMSYCLRYRSKGAVRTVAEVRNEVWATTKHIMDKFQARWKVVLVNTEPMDADDVEGMISGPVKDKARFLTSDRMDQPGRAPEQGATRILGAGHRYCEHHSRSGARISCVSYDHRCPESSLFIHSCLDP